MPKGSEPMGAAEVAAFLGVERGTVHQWSFRELLPAPDWEAVNGAPAWDKRTIIGWAIATGRLQPEEIPEREAAYEPASTRRNRR